MNERKEQFCCALKVGLFGAGVVTMVLCNYLPLALGRLRRVRFTVMTLTLCVLAQLLGVDTSNMANMDRQESRENTEANISETKEKC